MGFLFTAHGPVEAGIDGFIEIRDRETGHVSGRLVAVQVKTIELGRYTGETDRASNACVNRRISPTGSPEACRPLWFLFGSQIRRCSGSQ
jgi:hypothetical protein